MADDSVTLERARLLWRTRGQRWDYLFLLRPSIPGLPGWLRVFEHLFSSARAPAEGVLYLRGRLRVRPRAGSERIHHLVAAALTDPVRSDFAGRRVQHFFIYLLANEHEADQFTIGWAERLLAGLQPAIDHLFELERGDESPASFTERLVTSVEDVLPSHLEIGIGEAGQAPVVWQKLPDFEIDEEAEAEKKVPGPGGKAPGPMPTWGWAAVILAILMLVILLRS